LGICNDLGSREGIFLNNKKNKLENNMHEVQLELFDPPLSYRNNDYNERIEHLEYAMTQIGLRIKAYQETKEDSVLEGIPSYINSYFSKYS